MKSKAAAGVGSSSPSSFPTPGLCLIGGPGLLFDSLARSQQPLVKGKGLLQDPGLPHYRLHAAPSWLAGPLVPGRGLQGRFQSDPESERLLPAAPRQRRLGHPSLPPSLLLLCSLLPPPYLSSLVLRSPSFSLYPAVDFSPTPMVLRSTPLLNGTSLP